MKNSEKNTWQVQEAKTNLSRVLERAEKRGLQWITRHGRPRGAVVSVAAGRRIEAEREPKKDFFQFLMTMPKLDDETIAIINDRHSYPERESDHIFDEE